MIKSGLYSKDGIKIEIIADPNAPCKYVRRKLDEDRWEDGQYSETTFNFHYQLVDEFIKDDNIIKSGLYGQPDMSHGQYELIIISNNPLEYVYRALGNEEYTIGSYGHDQFLLNWKCFEEFIEDEKIVVDSVTKLGLNNKQGYFKCITRKVG